MATRGTPWLPPLAKTLARLPWPALYAFAWILYVVAYYIIGYRKSVVRENLLFAFPDKSERERKKIEKGAFKHLTQMVVETFKSLRLSPTELMERCKLVDGEALQMLKSEKNGAIVTTAHYGNWEYAGLALGMALNKPMQVVYKKLTNGDFNELMLNVRTHFGNGVTPMENVFKSIYKGKDEGLITCFVADQTPLLHPGIYWTNFMNRQAPFFTGPEKIATRIDLPVYFVKVVKTKRGHYEVHFQIITTTPRKHPEDYITGQYATFLEDTIRSQPETWLWTHRRWKHVDKAPLNQALLTHQTA